MIYIYVIFVMLMLDKKVAVGLADPTFNETVPKTMCDVREATPVCKKLDMEGIEKWADVGYDLMQVSVDKDSESLIKAAQTLSNAIPYLGPILSGLLDMIPHSSGFEEIKQQLVVMDSHLFAIENKIDALSKRITHTNILSYFKSKAQSINVIQMSYQRYLRTNTNVNLNELIDQCKRNNILEYVFYVHQELTDTTSILPLMTVMKDNNNLANFQNWMKMLVGSVSQSMFLHTICMFAQYKNETDLNDSMNGDISDFSDLSDIMLKTIRDGTNDIKRNFFATAKEEIYSYAQTNLLLAHDDFVERVWHMLAKKYYWRYWFVASYDPVSGSNRHYVRFASKYVYAWFRQFGRNVNIVHTNNIDNSIDEKLNDLMESVTHNREWSMYDDCVNIYEDVKDRIGEFNGLGVVWFAYNLYAYSATGSASVHHIYNIRNAGFSVFAVAPEK